jgi:hypothetical protein
MRAGNLSFLSNQMAKKETMTSSIALLETFWKRHTFHDMEVESIHPVNRRVIIRLDEYTLVVTQVTKFTKKVEEFPTSWLYHRWADRGAEFALHVDLELGEFDVVGRDLRLIRNNDMAVLIPAVDA